MTRDMIKKRRHRPALQVQVAVVLALVGLLLAGCGAQGGSLSAAGGKLKIVATIGMITDIARIVGGEHVEVTGIMGPGVDPHLYKASQDDVRKLNGAQMILYNGLNLEGKMADIFVKMARSKQTVAVTESIPRDQLREPPEFGGHYDPHVWFDVSLWMRAVDQVRDALVNADPAHRQAYEQNAARYLQELQDLHQWVKGQLAEIPRERRVLVTAHDAFGYFGRAYDVEVVGLQGISTESEYGLKDVQTLVDTLVNRRVKAVFVESSVPDTAIKAVVEGARKKGHTVSIGGELFSDAMGNEGTPEGTYIGMIRHNVETIARALK